ncbi:hypothetical protein ADK77_11395 [Streptomyces antibioticus]|nr:hypothetical protein ADK77_11395 [Streptomyces antibioticus]
MRRVDGAAWMLWAAHGRLRRLDRVVDEREGPLEVAADLGHIRRGGCVLEALSVFSTQAQRSAQGDELGVVHRWLPPSIPLHHSARSA